MPNLDELSKDITLELCLIDAPNVWRTMPGNREWWRTIYAPGAWLSLQINDGRLIVTTTKPNQMKPNGETERITCSMDRNPAEIARDIHRRIVPHARQYFAKSLEWSKTFKGQIKAQKRTLAYLAPFTQWTRADSDERRAEIRGENWRAEIITGDVYEIRIAHLTPEKAAEIIRLIQPERRCYYTTYKQNGKYFFTVTDRKTGKVIHDSASYSSLHMCNLEAGEITAELERTIDNDSNNEDNTDSR